MKLGKAAVRAATEGTGSPRPNINSAPATQTARPEPERASPIKASRRPLPGLLRPSHLLGIAIGIIALGLTYAAHANGRPITAALVAVFGVMGVGALLGTRAGLLAGFAASLTFNLVFTDPTWTFTYSTADDLVPMIALTLSAVGSGLLAGRLRDRAIAAETATVRLSELLRFSEDLQSAVTVVDVEAIARAYLAGGRPMAWLFLEQGGKLVSPSGEAEAGEAAKDCWFSHLPSLTSGNCTAHLLKSAEMRLGLLVVEQEIERSPDDVRVFLPLITLAIQRCQLAEQLNEANLLSEMPRPARGMFR